jgi:hypothetical protein
VGLELFDLAWRDRPATPNDDPDMLGAQVPEHVDHVTKILVVPALVGTAGDRIRILLQRSPDDVIDAAIVTEMNDLRTMGLQQAPDNVDCGVVSVE